MANRLLLKDATNEVIKLADNVELNLGSGSNINVEADYDVQLRWDGTDLDMLANADDTVWKIGNGTNSFDIWWYANTANSYLLADASAEILALVGTVRPRGFNALSDRLELTWVAGADGLVDLNATAASDLIDPRFEVLGTNATADDITYNAEGGLKLETDGADGDEVIILPHLDTSQSIWSEVTWGTDQQVTWEAHIKSGAAITNCIIWAGLKLTNTEVTATDDDQCFFRYENGVNSGKWQAVSSVGGTDDAHDSGVTVAVDTEYHLKIEIASDRTAKMYINGALVETSGALTDATDLIPYIGVASDGAAEAKHIYVYGQAISRAYA